VPHPKISVSKVQCSYIETIIRFTWTSPDGKTRNPTDPILIDMNGIPVCLMPDSSGEQTAILVIICHISTCAPC
jgi:hypothetical protein